MARLSREAPFSRGGSTVRNLVLFAAVGVTALGAAVMTRANAIVCIATMVAAWGAYTFVQLRRAEPGPVAASDRRSDFIDAETGLGNSRYFHDLLTREMARCERYGGRLAVALFDVRGVDSEAQAGEKAVAPSPAGWVAARIRDEFRQSDLVCRLDETHFAVLLAEAAADGARAFSERVRTSIGTQPFARGAAGKAFYARSWAGVAAWTPEMREPADLVMAAEADLMATQPLYDSARAWYAGA